MVCLFSCIAINLAFRPKQSLIGKMYRSMHDLKHTARSLGVLYLGLGVLLGF